WHRTFRDQFLSECEAGRITDLADLNARLWAWLEQVYHRTGHTALGGQTPLARYQQDLPRIRSLGTKAATLDALFYHRVTRFVKKDGTVSYQGQQFEVPYALSGKTVKLVVDPHAARVMGVESDAGAWLGDATALDRQANLHRIRRKPEQLHEDGGVVGVGGGGEPVLTSRPKPSPSGPNLVELAHQQYYAVAPAQAVSTAVAQGA
ncbi:MAG: hypothetical protein U1E02_24580, partial [Hydrogenophaga sp.]|nr:hypothetical protein [Hydrogenophaga sp.]